MKTASVIVYRFVGFWLLLGATGPFAALIPAYWTANACFKR